MISARDIRVRFGGVVAVDGVSLTVDRDEIVGLIGPNGSGKSTFINALTGLVPAEGSLEVDGRSVPLGRAGAVSRLGVLRTFQTPQVHDDLTCLENVLVVEHKIDFLEDLCHRMIVLELGKQIAAGEPAKVWADPRVMDAYLGSVVVDA